MFQVAGLLDALAGGPMAITHLPGGGGGPLFAQADWLLAVGLLAATHYLYHAIESIDVERVTLQREIDALDEFIAQVESLAERATGGGPAEGGATVAANPAPAGPTLQAVRDCYRDTVMSVAHYDEAYGESLAEHVEREFGAQYADVLTGSGRPTGPLLQGLVVQATQAKHERETVLDAIDREESSVDRARAAYADVEDALESVGPRLLNTAPFEDLRRRWDRLDTARERVERVLDRRQDTVQELTCRRRPEDDPMFLQDFLYDDLDTRFPVLDRGTTLLGRIDASQGRLVDALSTRT